MHATCIIKKEEVLARLGGDEELLHEIVQMYFEDYPELLSQIEGAVESDNAEVLARAAHQLKGLLSNFSSPSTTVAIQALEQAGKLNQMRESRSRLQVLAVELSSLSSVLNSWRR